MRNGGTSVRDLLIMARQGLLAAAAATFLISCASAPSLGHAEDADLGRALDEGPVRVLVLGEDAHANLVPRYDPAFQRVMGELQEIMARRGFRVVDEQAIAADLGWDSPGYLDRAGVLELAKLANASELGRSRVRAAVVFRIEASARTLSYTSRIALHVSGELYDVTSNRYLGGFDLPTETISTGRPCDSMACASDAVGTRARDLATELGAVLSRKLAHLSDPDDALPLRVAGMEGN